MVYYGGTKKARYISSITAKNQGGGDKKAGLPYQIGRDQWSSMSLGGGNVGTGSCCGLPGLQKNLISWRVSASRGIGSDVRIPLR